MKKRNVVQRYTATLLVTSAPLSRTFSSLQFAWPLQTSYGTWQVYVRGGQLCDPQLVPEVNDDDDE